MRNAMNGKLEREMPKAENLDDDVPDKDKVNELI